ncbi:MAG: UDP-N-acetylmuramoyl-L-alanine--D-glutamate ligase [Desulfobacterota bacterium]|jgi:UDP-N-acetylmuramoylalanine--D-glutamate ligase|nr:UDP-N-acetylmuramoyl-L-alanine--D-glutamate ligase [Thermodesulfobacteriota bacterium]
MEWTNKKILVVGLGKSGLSVVRYLVREGARVTVSDRKEEAKLSPDTLREMKFLGVTLETGGHTKGTFLRADRIIVSPGVPLDLLPLKAAREKGIPVTGEMDLAVQIMNTPVVAITGTNGKSTVTAFLGELLQNAGHKVFVGGNLGTPLIEYAASGARADVAVVEVSSFQLDTLEGFSPLVALLLNLSPDHLDRYPNYGAYVQSKLKIFKNQGAGDFAVLNDDDDILSSFSPPKEVYVLRYGLKKKGLRHAFAEGKGIRAGLPCKESHFFDLQKCPLPGKHNVENMMAATLAGLAMNVEPPVIQSTLERFQGLPHRLEHVGRVRKVDFYNDSKATNVDAALRSIASFDRPIVLIAGGRHKGGDYAPLVRVAKGRVKKAFLMGESKPLLAEAFEDKIPYATAEDMEDAVNKAFSVAKPHDVVLLAPACSSFDMFTDYAHRGRAFKEAVERLQHG